MYHRIAVSIVLLMLIVIMRTHIDWMKYRDVRVCLKHSYIKNISLSKQYSRTETSYKGVALPNNFSFFKCEGMYIAITEDWVWLVAHNTNNINQGKAERGNAKDICLHLLSHRTRTFLCVCVHSQIFFYHNIVMHGRRWCVFIISFHIWCF